MADAFFPLCGKRVFIAGETGMVGRALYQKLQGVGAILLSEPHEYLDLRDASKTYDWLCDHKPDAVFMAAALVGGIGANMARPAEFLHDNLAMGQSVIDGCHRAGVPRLLYLGSSCIYPKYAPQPILEESLLTGELEPTNESYAIAKIAGLKMIESYRRQYGRAYIAAMPTNLYGPHDRFDPDSGHVIPALIEKFHTAKLQGAEKVCVWGSGRPLREFLYAPDLAEALVTMMEYYDGDVALNIGSGEEVTIKELAQMVADVTGYEGRIMFDKTQPDGTPRKYLNTDRLRALGWSPQMRLVDGLKETYRWYVEYGPLSRPQAPSYASSGT